MEFSGRLVLAAMSMFVLAQMPATSGQTLNDDIAVTFSIEKRWFGGFIGKLHLNFTEDADYWLFDVTFPRNVFALETSGSVAKVGKENHRSYRFADLPWSRHVQQGDTAEVLFYAKTWRKVRGLKATVTKTKAYPERPCIRTCGLGFWGTTAIHQDWNVHTAVLLEESIYNHYEFNDYYTISVSGQRLPASASVNGLTLEPNVYLLSSYALHRYTYRSPQKMAHLGRLYAQRVAMKGPQTNFFTVYTSGTDGCSCFNSTPL